MVSHLPYGLLLDMDDTLVQYDAAAEGCWRDACAACLPAGSVAIEDALEAIRTYSRWYWSDPERHRRGRLALGQARLETVASALQPLGCQPADAERIAILYQELRAARLDLFPGTLETLATLRQQVGRLALVTNGDSEGQRAKIERFGLAEYFDCICIEGERGIGKPDEAVYALVLDELGLDPAQCWMVGDNLEWDVAAPQRVGVKGVWVDARGAGLPADCGITPHRVIRRLSDLLDPVER